MRVIILIDWGTCRNALQVAEHLVSIGICLLLLTIIAIALNAIIGLVEPDRTAPVTLWIVLRIIGSYRRERDEGRELLLVVEQLSCFGKLLGVAMFAQKGIYPSQPASRTKLLSASRRRS